MLLSYIFVRTLPAEPADPAESSDPERLPFITTTFPFNLGGLSDCPNI
jgi:hypothetical protein